MGIENSVRNYLVTEWKRLVFPEVKIFRVVVNNLRFWEPSSLREKRSNDIVRFVNSARKPQKELQSFNCLVYSQ